MLSLQDLKSLQDIYGKDAKLSDIIARYGYECPQCKGKGFVMHSGLWGYTEDYKVKCDLCKGKGTTSVEYKPKMVQQGWTTE